MTGFLQRLAMGMRAPSRLHPFVGSMFAAPPPEAVAVVLPRGDALAASENQVAAAPTSTTAADQARRAPGPAPPAPPIAGALPARVRRLDEQPVDQPRHDARDGDARAPALGAARASFHPLLARVEAEADAKASAAESSNGPAKEPGTPRSLSLAHHAGRHNPLSATPVFVSASATEKDGKIEVSSAPVAGARRKPAGDEWRAAARPRQPSGEDIHIHIGRVEVTAVPPPAPRPAAAPARKTMTLEEYLGRRNGASR